MLDFERLVVVTASHGEKFLGEVPDGKDPQDYLENESIILHNVRLLATQHQPKMDARQNIVGVAVLTALLQVDMFPGPVPVMRLHPSSWYFPTENEEAVNKLKQLIDRAEANETKNRAQDAGLVVPGRA